MYFPFEEFSAATGTYFHPSMFYNSKKFDSITAEKYSTIHSQYSWIKQPRESSLSLRNCALFHCSIMQRKKNELNKQHLAINNVSCEMLSSPQTFDVELIKQARKRASN